MIGPVRLRTLLMLAPGLAAMALTALVPATAAPSSVASTNRQQSAAATPRLFFERDGWVETVRVSDPSRIHRIWQTPSEVSASVVRNRRLFLALQRSYTNGAIVRVRTDGTHAKTLVTHLNGVLGLAVAGRFVYWLDEDAVGRMRPDGSHVQRRFVVPPKESGGGVGDGLATDGLYLYITRCQTDSIGRVAIDGTDLQTRFIDIGGDSCPQHLTANDHHLYWTELSYRHNLGYIGRADLSGSNVRPGWLSIQSASGPFQVAVGGRHVYWTTVHGAGGSVQWVGRAGTDRSNPIKHFVTGGDGIAVS
jgi:hypothetical protein